MCNNVQYFAGYKFVTRSNLDTLPCGILVKKPARLLAVALQQVSSYNSKSNEKSICQVYLNDKPLQFRPTE